MKPSQMTQLNMMLNQVEAMHDRINVHQNLINALREDTIVIRRQIRELIRGKEGEYERIVGKSKIVKHRSNGTR